ncbi:MAG: DNA (cytosine-5-)-methyltransferase [Oscillatoria sp. PMC 1076.18]|nr:DNA (cytosine-5-)-methyltransferase [Oscillatoria sp. PMC 1076.18]
MLRSKANNNQQRLFDLEELETLQKELSGEYKILEDERKTNFKIIELFAGCGGMALGLENAGLQTNLLVEIDKNCVNTLLTNRPQWQIIHDDVANLNFTKYRGEIDIVAGGFPCQAFSYAGFGKGFADTRGTLFFEFARCVSEVKPKIAIAENVRGLISHQKGKTLAKILKVLDELGYSVTYKLLSAQFLDVPQKRERVIIIAIRKDLNIEPLFPREKNYTISLKEALKNCPSSLGVTYNQRKKAIMELVPPGGNWRNLPVEIQKTYMKQSYYRGGGRTGFAKRLAWNEPALTITCSPAQTQTERCHPDETRPLTVREYARIQTFPDEWEFTGSLTSQYKQIGNAVPVNMAYHLGKALIAMLSKKRERERQVSAPKISAKETTNYIQLSIPGLNL